MYGRRGRVCTCTAQTLKPLKLLVKFWHSLFPIFASELLLLLKFFFFGWPASAVWNFSDEQSSSQGSSPAISSNRRQVSTTAALFSWILSLAGGERQVGTRGTFRRAYLVNAGVSTRRYF